MSFKLKQEPPSNRDRRFFHDLINHTHGLLLYLASKKSKNCIDQKDLIILEKEIRNLQVIIQDHFKIEHRNLTPSRDSLSLDDFYKNIEFMADTYFLSKGAFVTLNFEKPQNGREIFFEHKAILLRIFTNILKNIAESDPSNICISIVFLGSAIVVTTQNGFVDNSNRKTAGDPIGLHSIETLTLELDGKYDYWVQDKSIWFNKLVIPFKQTQLVLPKVS